MFRLIQSEYIKGKRSFGRKSLVLFPLLVVAMSILLMGGQLTQVGAYNWWYALLLPLVMVLICINLIDSDKRLGFFNLAILPISPAKVWQAKIWLGCVYLLTANVIVFGFTSIAGALFSTEYPWMKGILAALILTVTFIWQIPLGMFLTVRLNATSTFLSLLLLNIVCSTQDIAGGSLWFIPFAIPARMMAVVLEINPNGIQLEATSPLHNPNVLLPGILINMILFILLFVGTTKGFQKKEDIPC